MSRGTITPVESSRSRYELKLKSLHGQLPLLFIVLNAVFVWPQGSRVLMVLGGQDRWANQPNSVTNQKTVEVLDLATRSNWVKGQLDWKQLFHHNYCNTFYFTF